jgi:transposase
VARGAARVRAVVEGGAAAHPLVARGGVGARLRLPARRRAARARRGLPRRHLDPGAPEGGRGQGGAAAAHALGRSRGGYGTKACAACDAPRGRPLGFALLPGQASELRAAPLLLGLAALLGAVLRVVCDASYSSARWLASIRALGAEPVVRPNPTHRSAPAHDRAAYRRRHRIENLWARLKEWRAVASFLGGLHLAAAFEWLSNGP